ncbi:MAG: hypothetical protein HY746_08580 [Elusimicrobia bacterium]|nr:hypothetical protein [Elusimicrobiota bacterium]
MRDEKLKILVGIFGFIIALLFISCQWKSGGEAGRPENRAVVFETRTYSIGRIPDQEKERLFQNCLEESADSVLKNIGSLSADIGFSYTMTPRGAVYPFSEIEISCLVQAKYSRRYARSLCSEFFKEVEKEYDRQQ